MPAATRPKILFVAVEDWFFASHFLPMARAAIAEGYAVVVATRVRDHRSAIEATGARVIAMEGERGSRNPAGLAGEAYRLMRVLKAERPDILHLIGLRPILVGSLAGRGAGILRRVVAVTGLGLIGAQGGGRNGLFLRRVVAPLAGGNAVRFVFENRSDPLAFGLSPDDAVVTILGGAGVDPEVFRPSPLPGRPPLRLAMVSRMLWSKGVDTAVEAVTLARAGGADVTLSLFGAPDAANPKSVPESTLRGWAGRPGIAWKGRSEDVAGVWATHHAALQPSRGGEGLPRTILEAAACGRAVLTTDVPGCRDFVRDGVEGRVVPPDDPAALARAIAALAADPGAVERMGEAARARLLDGYTEAAVTAKIAALYREMLA